ncbi:hypothetical protein [Paenibacillus koleovorans]|uniref:hypothetical protein n=1 Tax=Paenibacillus koleovorans TaxID=121608 RepID=UPI000FDA4CA8|nr:hypothetical protein [Paenibacillus koleovorans]
MIGIEMHLPDGKRPGYYAQVVKALADIPLFDRDKETLIVSGEPEAEAVRALMQDYKFEYEEFGLLLLPDGADVRPSFTDYGFESRSGNRYLMQAVTARFVFDSIGPDGNAQALAQMEEHLIASWSTDGEACYAADSSLGELMHGIARAYGCTVRISVPEE